MNMKKTLAILISFCMLLGGTIVQADNISQVIGDGNTVVFVDVPENYWAKNEIQYFASREIVSGNGDGTFAPESGVTREQFCKMLVLTFNAPLATSNSPIFSDVNVDRWSYPYIEVCKDFLTGYANPFGGLPAFHPEEYATREDIAVALVRMMGLTDSDVDDPNYANRTFHDAGNISPQLLKYVSLAAERGLISGYPDGTFGPTQGITRAETVVLLNRATKQAITNINAELQLSANVIYSTDGKTATINIEAEEGTKVTVDGESVNMNDNYYGSYEGNHVYTFDSEGSKTFTVEATKAGKTKTITVIAKYEIGVPMLSITQCPTTSDKLTATISGTVQDTNDSSPLVTINGKSISVWGNGQWSTIVDLTEGDNEFIIVATNNLGKTTTEKRTISFGVGAPALMITNCPTTSETETAIIKGTVKDTNDSSPLVTVNGKSISVWGNGQWSATVDLTEGDNEFIIIATNNLGKTTTEKRTISFDVSAPTLKITYCPSTSDEKKITIEGKVKDTNDSSPMVTVNGKSISVWGNGQWSATVDLTEGDNEFIIVATNNLGKTTTEKRTISFGVGAPALMITNCPTTSETETAIIKGTVKDTNDRSPLVTVNGKSISVWGNGQWSATVDLTEGDNEFTIVATNNLGKTTTEKRTIFFDVSAPTLKITYCPSTSDEKKITIEGKVKDTNDSSPMVTLNGKSISVWGNGQWSATVDLTEGDNEFIIVATNNLGKTSTIEKVITYNAPVVEE